MIDGEQVFVNFKELMSKPDHEQLLQIATAATGTTFGDACLVGGPLAIKKDTRGNVVLCCSTEVGAQYCMPGCLPALPAPSQYAWGHCSVLCQSPSKQHTCLTH